jgi:exodeoxyribonuclease VII small subunit
MATKNSKKTAAAKPTGDAPSFEQAIERLEKIVTDMESAELPLDDLLKRYEEGTRLVRFCSAKLNEAEKKIELLTKKADGSVELTPFEPGDDEPADDDEEAKLL